MNNNKTKISFRISTYDFLILCDILRKEVQQIKRCHSFSKFICKVFPILCLCVISAVLKPGILIFGFAYLCRFLRCFSYYPKPYDYP